MAIYKKITKKFFHDILGYHKPDNKYTFDGCSIHARCRICGSEIMRDSQGNWFAFYGRDKK